jgi:photosystem II stability/assembly factor-like uncharacterized protein
LLLTRDSHYLLFASKDHLHEKQINKFLVNKKEVVARFKHPAIETGMDSMEFSPDSNILYVGTVGTLLQVSLKDGKVMQSRNTNERPDMIGATIYGMRVTKNNQYLVTGTVYVGTPEKGSKEDLAGKLVIVGGPVCVWSTKDVILIKT